MSSLIQNFGVWLTILISISLPATSQAGRKIASVRAPHVIAKAQFQMTPARREALRLAKLDAIVDTYRTARTSEGLQNLVRLGLNSEDGTEAAKLIREMGEPPTAKRDGEALVFTRGSEIVRIEWTPGPETLFNINGVSWIYDSKKPLKFQLGLLEKKLRLHESKSAFSEWLLPSANAFTKDIAMALINIVISVGISNFLPDIVCTTFSSAFKETSMCMTYAMNMSKGLKEQAASGATVQVAAQQRSSAADDDAQWLPGREGACPSRDDKSKNVYLTQFVQIKKDVPQGDWAMLRMEFTPDGKPTVAYTAPAENKLETPEDIEKANNVMKFDDKGLLSIEIPNTEPKVDGDPGWKPTVKIDMITVDSKLEPEQRARRDQMKSLVKTLDGWIGACLKRELVKKYIKEHGGLKRKKTVANPDEVPEAPSPAASRPAIQ